MLLFKKKTLLKFLLFAVHFLLTIYNKAGIEGRIQGEVFGDTLSGKIKYIPYRHKNEIIKAFSLLLKGDTVFIGKGVQMRYLEIPYHARNSLDFTSKDSVLYKVK